MISPSETAQLRQFHALHFPQQSIPNISPASNPQQYLADEVPSRSQLSLPTKEVDDLGYYEDGVKRTLTDEQVKMFRHSEIQRLLSERRAAREKEERDKRKQERGTFKAPSAGERKRHFDEPEPQDPGTEALMYDDPPDDGPRSKGTGKKFVWPTLGTG